MQLIFDMGGTKTRLALVENGNIGKVIRLDTDKRATGFAKLSGALEELGSGSKVDRVVGCMPGQLAGEEGELVWSPNLPEWLGVPVLERLKMQFQCPVKVVNDVVLGGIGEAYAGAGITKGVMVYFTVSTGLNAVRIVDGMPDETIERFEIGQQLVPSDDGGYETLESRLGGAAIEKRYGRPPGEIKDEKVWRLAVQDLALGLYNTLLHWTPQVVVFGGSMMRDIELKLVSHELERLPKVMPVLPRLEYAKLDDLAGLNGALAILKH